jgi:threonine aldolase
MGSIVDLRSDTVTRPTPEMRRVIAEAEVGDAVLGDDPTVQALEEMVARMLGKDRALFFPSGIMANQTAVLVQTQPGTEVVIEAGGHILNYEEGGAAALAGVQLRPVVTPDGLMTVENLAAAIRPRSAYSVQTSLLCLENTHNVAGGRILPLDRMGGLVEVARDRGVPVHLDGARLPNAAVAVGMEMRRWAELSDTVMIALSKGLGAPVGSLLAGSEELMAGAARVRRRLGGGMRQAGLLAAAGIHALRHHLTRLHEDHTRAKLLAASLHGTPGLSVNEPETNIVLVDLGPELDGQSVLQGLEQRGVRMIAMGERRLRAVLHMDVSDAGVELAAAALREATSAHSR